MFSEVLSRRIGHTERSPCSLQCQLFRGPAQNKEEGETVLKVGLLSHSDSDSAHIA